MDDPYAFGQIAAANALSDIYAMGGIPKTAMNLVAFPLKTMDISVLRQSIQGGLDKMTEADVVLIGGHSIEDRATHINRDTFDTDRNRSLPSGRRLEGV